MTSPDSMAQPAAVGQPFRFTDPNPLTGRPYARSRWDELPYLVWLLIRDHVGLTESEWDRLAAAGGALDAVGSGEFRVPFTLDVTHAGPDRVGTPPAAVCQNCWGTGYEVDTDTSMTGVTGALFVCTCTGAWM